MTFISGRRNCHLKGLNSYVIRDRVSDQDGMLRVFHNTGDCLPRLVRDGQFCLAPHNHRQDIKLTLLTGSAYNVSFKWDARAPEKHFVEWHFYSLIVDGEICAHFKNTGDLRIDNITPLSSAGLFIPCADIHTVVASPGAAWLVQEGNLAPKDHKSLCYSRHKEFRLSQDGLYEEMNVDDLVFPAEMLGDRIEGVLKGMSA